MSFSALLLAAALVPVAALGGAVVSAPSDHGRTLHSIETHRDSTHVMGSPARRLTNPITRCCNHPITAMQGQTTAEAPTKDLTLNDLR
jgi:hypothetical protein